MRKVTEYCSRHYEVPLSRQNFIDLVKKVSNIKGFPDLTNPSRYSNFSKTKRIKDFLVSEMNLWTLVSWLK